MVRRLCFVSNSSSSSFIISKAALSLEQKKQIFDHRNSGLEDADTNYWDITEDEYFVMGDTDMDNFDMHHFLRNVVKVDPKAIRFE